MVKAAGAFVSILALTFAGRVATATAADLGTTANKASSLPRSTRLSYNKKPTSSKTKVQLEHKNDRSIASATTPVVFPRGGAAPLNKLTVARFATIISLVNAGWMSLAPTKTLDAYGLDKTPLTEYMTEWIGHISLSQAISQWCVYFNGNTAKTAMGAGTLYLAVFSIKSLLNDMPQTFGFSAMGQYIFLAINAFCGHSLLYNTSNSDTVAKAYPVWGLMNALSFCLAPKTMGQKWGVGNGAVPLVTYEMKQTGYVLATKAIYYLSLGYGVEPTKALGYGNVPALLGMVMTNFVSKEIHTFGMDMTAQWIWLLLKAVVVSTLAF